MIIKLTKQNYKNGRLEIACPYCNNLFFLDILCVPDKHICKFCNKEIVLETPPLKETECAEENIQDPKIEFDKYIPFENTKEFIVYWKAICTIHHLPEYNLALFGIKDKEIHFIDKIDTENNFILDEKKYHVRELFEHFTFANTYPVGKLKELVK